MTHPKTRVVHCKRSPHDVYIGRPSKWGNPFVLEVGPRGSNRAEVIARYRAWLQDQIAAGKLDPTELRGLVLGCWCAPLPCHGDVLAELADAPTDTSTKETK